jgi:hypothetical protein
MSDGKTESRRGTYFEKDKMVKPQSIDKYIPNPKNHRNISFLKSFIRVIGYMVLFPISPEASIILCISEGIGVIEELV